MAQRDYYEVLGIGKDADAGQIKRPTASSLFNITPIATIVKRLRVSSKASEAYEVLSDDSKRQVYDHYGHDGLRNQGFSGFSGAGVEDIFHLSRIFSATFGMGGGRRRGRRGGPQRGSDMRVDVVVDFEDAVFGTEQTIEVEQRVSCTSCKGQAARWVAARNLRDLSGAWSGYARSRMPASHQPALIVMVRENDIRTRALTVTAADFNSKQKNSTLRFLLVSMMGCGKGTAVTASRGLWRPCWRPLYSYPCASA